MALKKIKKSRLTESEKIIYNYLNENFNRIPILKIEDIINNTYTSGSTVTRLSKKLGFNGWKELKKACIRKMNKITGEVENSIVIKTSIEAMKKLDKMNPIAKYKKISSILEKAKNIYIYGSGINKMIADIASQQLLLKGYYSRSASCNNSEIKIAKNLTRNDVAIFISFSGKTKKVHNVVNNINKNVETISITKNNKNTLAKLTKHVMLVPDIEATYKHSKRITRLNKIMLIDSLMNLVKNK